MTQVTLDTATLAKLVIGPSVEVCDASGKVVGVFTPAKESSTVDGWDLPVSREEIEQARLEPGGRSLDEILHDLEGRG
jgi:hypothetical protein